MLALYGSCCNHLFFASTIFVAKEHCHFYGRCGKVVPILTLLVCIYFRRGYILPHVSIWVLPVLMSHIAYVNATATIPAAVGLLVIILL